MGHETVSVLITVVLVGAGGSFIPAQAQESRCASCHFANIETAPAQDHTDLWDRSPHGRAGVGCERCHGGDATTFETALAHRGVLGWGNPASPVHRGNIPGTCGRCHQGPYRAFQESWHFQLLAQGNRNGPTCVTCHGEVAANLPSPRGLRQRCERCHGPDGTAPRPGRAQEAGALLEAVAELRESLGVAERLIARVRSPSARAELKAALVEAEAPLTQAVQSGHRFVFDMLTDRLGVARERTGVLLGRLANPSP